MSDSSAFGFGKFIPGFDFLQGLANAAIPGVAGNTAPASPLASWMAPTLDVDELERRIRDLKTVQFWLDQNATALKATIQALEVQKMTLATLQSMNLQFGAQAGAKAAGPASAASAPPEPAAPSGGEAAAAATVDPLQWWGALTQQFQQIATSALQDTAVQTALKETGAMASGLAQQAMQAAAGIAPKPAAGASAEAPPAAIRAARKTAAKPAPRAGRDTASRKG